MHTLKSAIQLLVLIIWTLVIIVVTFLTLILTFHPTWVLVIVRKVWAPFILFVMGVKLEVQGLQHFEKDKNYIIISNHTSYLDIPILLSAMPRNIYFIAKKELMRVPLFGWMMWLLGMIFIDRKNAKRSLISMKKAALKLKSGKNVLVFPEGTFDDSPGLLPFKKGAFHIAVRANIPLLPVVIKGAENVWAPNQILNFTKGKVTVKFGEAFKKEGDLDNVKMVQELKEKAERNIQNLLEN